MNIAILGAGAYGMALASVLHNNKCNIKMWTNNDEEKKELLKKRKSPKVDYLIPDDIIISTDMEEVVKDSNVIIFVTPSMFMNDVCTELKKYYNKQFIGIASKGFDNGNFLYDVIKNSLHTKRISIISGCTFAEDMVKSIPLGLNVASKDKNTRLKFYNILSNDYLKVNITKDVIGTELCGAIKNIYAIGMGILTGMNALESTKAMYMTEVLKEMQYLVMSFGGTTETTLSYAGIGDLILTCNSDKSRNFSLGKMIGEDKKKAKIDDYIKNTTIEGLNTLNSLKEIVDSNIINLSIIYTIEDIINNKKEVKELEQILIK